MTAGHFMKWDSAKLAIFLLVFSASDIGFPNLPCNSGENLYNDFQSDSEENYSLQSFEIGTICTFDRLIYWRWI